MSEQDVLRLRFAVSPLWETLAAVRAITTGPVPAVIEPWRRSLDLAGLDAWALAAVQAQGHYTPDFLTPPPVAGERSIDTELDLVRQTPTAVVRDELQRCLDNRRAPGPDDPLRSLVARPAWARELLVRQMRAAWERLLLPSWPRLHRVLATDVDHRSQRLVTGGIAHLLEDLDPAVSWSDSSLRVRGPVKEARDLAGEGVVLMPSVFVTGRPLVVLDEPYQPTLIYRARGIANAWEGTVAPADALVRLLGRGRADLLALLDSPAGTGSLAVGLARSAGTVSEHLQVLRTAGLVDVRRTGRTSRWTRTALGDALVAGPLTS
ncbi:MAG: putative transcriptional regulator, ArsR family [Frankiales bacterium]|nr:putative transcriptional regulator, ArsR family [Frankiales bacterium]